MALRLAVGVSAAAFWLLLGPRISRLAHARPGFVPIAIALLMLGLLLPRVRHWVIVTLCFSVALLAGRDTFRPAPLPPALNNRLFDLIYPEVWLSVALLAAAAGILEAIRPGSLAARRCYFGTAALYCFGHGLTKFLWEPAWEPLIIMITGLVAGLGVGFAHRLDAEPREPAQDEQTGEERLSRQRSERIAAHEWLESEDERAAHLANRS